MPRSLLWASIPFSFWKPNATTPVPVGGRYYFVMTSGTWTGASLGGLASADDANDKCLADLTANDWKGKSQATLDATTVKAFLCNGTVCQDPQASTGYIFAKSGSASAGGASLYINSSAQGPGVEWDTQIDTAIWSASHYFGSTGTYWSGRNVGSDTAWGLTSIATHCGGWLSTSGSGRKGAPNTAGSTSSAYWSSTTTGLCTSSANLVCLVANPGVDDLPTTFDFTDTTGAPGTHVQSSAVVTGFVGSLVASVMVDSGTATREVRKNNSGAWGRFVEIASGETLNVRMMPSSTSSQAKTMHITLGQLMVDWTVTTNDIIPDAFTFTPVEGVTPLTQHESSTTISGFVGSITASVTGGAAEIRVNGAGAWGSSVSVSPGDTINIRGTSSALNGAEETFTVTAGGVAGTWSLINVRDNLFVLSSTTFPANFGAFGTGIAGADAACLSDLQANSFKGKTGVVLNSTTVKAWICDRNGCNDLNTNEDYYYAVSGDSTKGGAVFSTTGTASGPGNSLAWSHATAFGSTLNVRTGRLGGGPSAWNTGTAGTTFQCDDWTLSSGGSQYYGLTSSTVAARWGSSVVNCATSLRIICSVTASPRDSLPDVFSFTRLDGATPNTQVETSAVITGFDGVIAASITGGEVRANGAGAWGATVNISAGDTLNVRVTTSVTEGAKVAATVSVGLRSAVWDVMNMRENLFVRMSSSRSNGSLGGLAGADSICLTNLQAQDFQGKGGVTLDASTVKAFLCDSDDCNQLQISERYYFAQAGNMNQGGDYFTTDNVGRGPGDGVTWEAAGKFSVGTDRIATGRGTSGSSTLWSPNPAASDLCSDWSSTLGTTVNGDPGAATSARWNAAGESGSVCGSLNAYLVCVVSTNPIDQTPDAFALTDVYVSAPSTLHETSVVVTGFTGPVTAAATNGAEVRVNGTGAWGSSVAVMPGETVNLRMYSSVTAEAETSTDLTVGTELDTWNITNTRENYMVLSSGTWDGNLGGLAGANAKCLDDLTNNDFRGKAAATLTSNRVQALLCDTDGCQTVAASTKYYFAKSGDPSLGGASFTSGASWVGPGDSQIWNATTVFGATTDVWSARVFSGGTNWSNSPVEGCSDWTSTAGSGGYGRTNATDGTRWYYTSKNCTNTLPLYCLVTKNPVDVLPTAFSFATLDDVTEGVTYETSAVVTGFDGPLVASVTSGLVRKNGTGSWASSVSVDPGDTLNLSAVTAEGTGIVANVTLGIRTVSWTLNNKRDHFFVLTAGTWNGNLGGLAGANAKCLSDLTANDWKGKAGVTLNASTVKAFICDGSAACTMPEASKAYYFATSGDVGAGGALLMTVASGNINTTDSWVGATYFNNSDRVWTGRSAGVSTTWNSTAAAQHCSNFASNSVGTYGSNGTPNTINTGRWYSVGLVTCDTASRLYCLVDGD